ncbi:GrpB family protein [Ideonella sp. YS5]|uniref:GrpB family protein n=1 Tax=Ideonella sp. YS5 TaxID=3453714 RepID=UPI003EEEEC05
MVVLQAYDPGWPALFETESLRLRAAFGSLALQIEHVGSTAVPGLAAKPVIDIQVSVSSLAPFGRYVPVLAGLGYRHVALGDFDLVYPFFHKPAEWPGTHHVHLCEAAGEQEWKHLAFRDHLRAHPQMAARYEALKRELAGRHDIGTPRSMEAYSLAKSEFVAEVLRAARHPQGDPAR